MEPFSLRRYVTGAELQVYNIHPDAHLPVVRKINQDRGAIAHPYGNDKNTALFSVFDGHGEFGDHVAEYAMIQTLSKLKNHPGMYFKCCLVHTLSCTTKRLAFFFQSLPIALIVLFGPYLGFKTDLTAAFQEVFLEIDADLEKSASRKVMAHLYVTLFLRLRTYLKTGTTLIFLSFFYNNVHCLVKIQWLHRMRRPYTRENFVRGQCWRFESCVGSSQ